MIKAQAYSTPETAPPMASQEKTQLEKFFEVVGCIDTFEKIKKVFISQIPHPDAEDIIQDAILKVADIIQRKGIKKDSDFIAYLFLTYRNIIYNLNQKKQRFHFIDINSLAESSMVNDEEKHSEALVERRKREKEADNIFLFVDENFSPISSGLFKFYHKTKLTYKQISELTGFSYSYIWKNNAAIKKEIIRHYGKNDNCGPFNNGRQ